MLTFLLGKSIRHGRKVVCETMLNIDALGKYGFEKDQVTYKLRSGTIQEMHIDVCYGSQDTLLARIISNDVRFDHTSDRVVFRNDDNIVLINLPFCQIKDSVVKRYKGEDGGLCEEFVFSVGDITYKLVAYNASTTKMVH